MTLASSVCIPNTNFRHPLTSRHQGGVLTLTSFENDFGYTKKEATRNSSLAVGLQQLGAFLACFAIWPVTHRFGRKWALVLCSSIFVVGAYPDDQYAFI